MHLFESMAAGICTVECFPCSNHGKIFFPLAKGRYRQSRSSNRMPAILQCYLPCTPGPIAQEDICSLFPGLLWKHIIITYPLPIRSSSSRSHCRFISSNNNLAFSRYASAWMPLSTLCLLSASRRRLPTSK